MDKKLWLNIKNFNSIFETSLNLNKKMYTLLFETPLNETCNICEKEQKHILPVPISLKINLMAIYVCGNKCFSKTFIATNIFYDKCVAQNI